MKNYKEYIAEVLMPLVDMDKSEILPLIELPPNKEMGDYAFPCFRLAKTMRKAPKIIADNLSLQIQDQAFERVEANGPYVNFFVSKTDLITNTIKEIQDLGQAYGSNDDGAGKTVVVEYSSTNIAKPFHIGHLRSTVIGESIKRLHQFSGYKTVAINYLGDYGTQFGVMIAAYELWGDDAALEENPIEAMLELYVRYNAEAEERPEMMDKARAEFNKLENGDDRAVALWTRFKDLSLKEYNRVYDVLNIHFDNYHGESYNAQFIPDVLRELREKNLLEKDEGAEIIRLDEDDLPPALIIKSDGSSTYMTRDIATAVNRKKVYDLSKNIYVVASQQRLHFQQLKAILKKMGYTWYDEVQHVSFGMVGMQDGTLSTRKGKVIFLEDVLNSAINKTQEIMADRSADIDNPVEIAQMVGVGAVKFQDMFNNRIKDYTFDWESFLNFDGETGPYVQYAHARSSSILLKADKPDFPNVDLSLLAHETEFDLAKVLARFPEDVRVATQKMEPSIISRALIDVAREFNRFYNACPIFSSEKPLRDARLMMTEAARQVLRNGLYLLGMGAPDQM